MSDKRDRTWHRERRPNFDDQPDYLSPPPRQPKRTAPAGSDDPVLDATVKSFNAEKGFGFVALSDGSPDAFLHINKLDKHAEEPRPGMRLRVRVGNAPRGPQVTEVLSVEPEQRVRGTVKWFDATKGFGFITPDDSGKDVFIPLRTVSRAGLSGLTQGQRVEVAIISGAKGPEAHALKPVDE
jgi:CspA family cold shock protein